MIDLVVIRLEEVTTFMDNCWLSEIGYNFARIKMLFISSCNYRGVAATTAGMVLAGPDLIW